jgi:hypothetical protein
LNTPRHKKIQRANRHALDLIHFELEGLG